MTLIQIKEIMKLENILIGKKVLVMTDAKVKVELEIKTVEENSQNHSQDLEPSTKENDWYPPQKNWTTYEIYIVFTNGFSKRYKSLSEIEVVE